MSPLGLFGTTLVLSAGLLFLIQPMFAKTMLPLVGGAPAVWNTCAVFFQMAVLAGYGYAHVTARWLNVRRQAALHTGVVLLPLLVLPFGAGRDWAPPAGDNPTVWLLVRLFESVGLPCFVVATSAPMLQRWFSGTRHPGASDPFFLYGASNVGSMLAVLSYPVAVEPMVSLAGQSRLWAGGYLLFVALVILCAVVVWRQPRAGSEAQDPAYVQDVGRAGPDLWTRLRWVLLALVPSSLMLSVTTFISTDIAAMPLLWMVPLALYLLSFVVAFARRPLVSHRHAILILPVIILPPVVSLLLDTSRPIWLQMPTHLAAFFVVALVCHGELARTRPRAAHLTDFYFWLSLGGVLGGLFNVLLAPVMFSSHAEYPIGLVTALWLRPASEQSERSERRGGGVPAPLKDEPERLSARLHLTVPVAIGLLALAVDRSGISFPRFPNYSLAFGLPLIVCVFFWHRTKLFALSVGVLLIVGRFHDQLDGRVLNVARSFFGIHRVMVDSNRRFHEMVHGGTIHGMQAIDPSRRSEPLSYYGRSSPIGQLFATRADDSRQVKRVAVLGLGVGTLASYAQPGEQWIFYEISPAVERQARETRYFSYLTDCGGPCRVVMGDARISLEREDRNGALYDIIVLDVFDSDAIPAHLLTREALAVYLRRLAPDGVIAVHTSNLYLELEPVVAALAGDAELVALTQRYTAGPREEEQGLMSSEWVLMGRNQQAFGSLTRDSRWKPLQAGPEANVWTDDFSNVFSALRWPSLPDILPGD